MAVETRRVVIPLYSNWPEAAPFRRPEDGNAYCVYREVEVPWICFHCGEPREEPRPSGRYHEWSQSCGCRSTYTDALKQAKEYLNHQPKADRNGQLHLF